MVRLMESLNTTRKNLRTKKSRRLDCFALLFIKIKKLFTSLKNKPYSINSIDKILKEIDLIIDNSEKPTFENTILAMELSGELLNRVATVFYALTSANTNDEMEKIFNGINVCRVFEEFSNDFLSSQTVFMEMIDFLIFLGASVYVC